MGWEGIGVNGVGLGARDLEYAPASVLVITSMIAGESTPGFGVAQPVATHRCPRADLARTVNRQGQEQTCGSCKAAQVV